MLKKIAMFVAASCVFVSSALAAVDVNSADQAALDGVAGIGPATSKAIIAEREKNGNFKDWSDLERRVKGVGGRNAVKLSAAGLTVNGQAHVPAVKPVSTAGASGSTAKAVDRPAAASSEKR